MRLKITLGEKGEDVRIGIDYRRYFMSFVKGIFARSGIFSDLYSDKKIKPFTFSVFLGNDFEILDREKVKDITAKLPFNFIFSTGDPVIFTHFYNGALEMKKESQGISFPGGKVIPIKDILLSQTVKINTSCCIFKTVGICVVTDKEAKAKDFGKWYCTPDEDNLERFNEVLESRMLEKYERIKGKGLNTQVKFTPISKKEMKIFIRQGKINPSFGVKPINEVYVKHYNGFIKGFKGVFYLESHPEMLQFIYDYGLGVRTGQGFGLLEVIAEI